MWRFQGQDVAGGSQLPFGKQLAISEDLPGAGLLVRSAGPLWYVLKLIGVGRLKFHDHALGEWQGNGQIYLGVVQDVGLEADALGGLVQVDQELGLVRPDQASSGSITGSRWPAKSARMICSL